MSGDAVTETHQKQPEQQAGNRDIYKYIGIADVGRFQGS